MKTPVEFRHRLVVDIGNTHSVIGLFRNGAIHQRWRLATRQDVTVDEIALWLQGFLWAEGVDRQSMEALALASVVPGVQESWMEALEKFFGIRPNVLDFRNCRGLKLDYDIPAQIGADRLCNVLGAYALGHQEGVVIDLGTATTFDVFADFTYWGGLICPGLNTAMRELARSASKLSEVELRWPSRFIGKTTDDALRSGILYGALGQFEYLLEGIFKEKKMTNPVVIATGGLAGLLKGKSSRIKLVEPDLTLIGLHHLLTADEK